MLEAGLPIGGVMLEGLWFDIGEPHHLLDAQAALLGGSEAYLHPGASVDASATVRASLLMDGARVHAGASVVSSILGANSVVEEGAVLERCVLGDGAQAYKNEHLVDVRRAA